MSMTCEEAGKKRWAGIPRELRIAHARMMASKKGKHRGGRPRIHPVKPLDAAPKRRGRPRKNISEKHLDLVA